MQAAQGQSEDILREAESLRGRRKFKRALALYEEVLRHEPDNVTAWLGAAECALMLKNRERALQLLGEPRPLNDTEERERWVNLRSEALRRYGDPQEGISLVEEWIGKMGAPTQAKLLVRKATFLARQRDLKAAAASVREAWAAHDSHDPRLMITFANVALLTGENGIAAEAGKRLLRSSHAVAGLYVYLFARFFAAHPLRVRLPVGLGTAALMLIPELRPALLGLGLFLGLGILVTWGETLVMLRLSLMILAAAIGVGSLLVLLASIEPVGNALGMILFLAIVIGAFLALRRARRTNGST
jgi:tetratricopeptide (TPR) repeat protein